MYLKYIKRIMDFVLSTLAVLVLSPVLIIFTVVNAIIMKGNPFFVQPRPGKDEKIFKLIKFRTMSQTKDENGEFLPDSERLTYYGKFLRESSIDELPELLNIIKGDMSIVGPRPQLVKDMVFMTPEQRRRHSVKPGLTGLAQISGRNGISWYKKFEYDLEYIDSGITFIGDFKIIFKTVEKVFKHVNVIREGTDSDIDFGDWLMSEGEITNNEYEEKQKQAKELLKV